jgi:hypothetical protein
MKRSPLISHTKMNVPPVLLYRRTNAPAGQEQRCCVSLILYPSVYEWAFLWNLEVLPEAVQQLVRTMLSHYSSTLALDLLIQQSDRDNPRNGLFGTDVNQPAEGEFWFLDHSNSLNCRDRWARDDWKQTQMIPLPAVLRVAVDKPLAIRGAEAIEALSDETIRAIVDRIPDDFMTPAHREMVTAGLLGRKQLVRQIIQASL